MRCACTRHKKQYYHLPCLLRQTEHGGPRFSHSDVEPAVWCDRHQHRADQATTMNAEQWRQSRQGEKERSVGARQAALQSANSSVTVPTQAAMAARPIRLHDDGQGQIRPTSTLC